MRARDLPAVLTLPMPRRSPRAAAGGFARWQLLVEPQQEFPGPVD